MRLNSGDVGKSVVVATSARISPVTYASLQSIAHAIRRRAKARVRLYERYSKAGRTLPNLTEIDPRYWQRDRQRRFNTLRTTCSLKDFSFQHEAEIRLAVRLGEETFTEDMLQEQAFEDPSHRYHELFNDHLKCWSFVKSTTVPEREFADCQDSFVESVEIDPRCPTHKADFMKAWFAEHGIRIVGSSCFGYLPDSFTIYPHK